MSIKLFLKAVATTLLLPGSVILLIPCLILHQTDLLERLSLSVKTILATVIALAALTVLLHCIWGFAFYGRGTLAPLDPPRVLVIRGLYQYTRNPMYLSVIFILLAETWLFSSVSMLLFSTLVILGFHLFVLYYEEPQLRSQFGASYQDYIQAVPRWGITFKSYIK
jgi:protein-S-isoprenylcysteine O-methyltransferase Ste14